MYMNANMSICCLEYSFYLNCQIIAGDFLTLVLNHVNIHITLNSQSFILTFFKTSLHFLDLK